MGTAEAAEPARRPIVRWAVLVEKTAGIASTTSSPDGPGGARGRPARWGWGPTRVLRAVAGEHEAVGSGPPCFDFTSFGKIDVRGPGALGLLQRLAANDVDRQVGSVIYTQFLNPRGGIESDLTSPAGAMNFRSHGQQLRRSDLGWIRMHMPPTARWRCTMSPTIRVHRIWGPSGPPGLEAAAAGDVSNAAFP